MSNFRNKNYKPTPSDLALATSTIWDRWFQDVTLDDDDGYRDVNGVQFVPGEYSQSELLKMLYDVVPSWTPGNYGTYGARQFLVNMIDRNLLTVIKADTRGKPNRYTVAVDPQTNEPYTREAFLQAAHDRRKAAWELGQRQKQTLALPSPRNEPQRLHRDDYADIMRDL